MSQHRLLDFYNTLVSYAQLQFDLVSVLKEKHGLSLDWDLAETVRNVKSGSKVSFCGHQWVLSRHGLGCKFTREQDGLTVDALMLLGSEPHGVDVASFESYLESAGIDHLTLLDKTVPIRFHDLKEGMEKPVIQDKLRKLDKHHRYEILSSN